MENLWYSPNGTTEANLAKQVRLLQLSSKKHVFSLLTGNYISTVKGSGLEFSEARKYVYGEPIKAIDWAITARMNEPYVKVFQEEREREIFICLDTSPSMHAGWQDRRKIEYAAELAASIAYTVTKSRDKLGFISYSDKVHEIILPRTGDVQFMSVLKRLVLAATSTPEDTDESDLRQAVHAIQKLKGKRYLVYFISDFIDYDFPDDLRYLKKSHDVSMIHLFDIMEYSTSKDISFSAYSPEQRGCAYSINPVSAGNLQEVQNLLKKESARYNIPVHSIDTRESITEALFRLFHSESNHG